MLASLQDVTYNDGEAVFPGTVFNKIWSVENTGSQTWPEGTRLICVSGFGKDLAPQRIGRQEVSYAVNPAKAGEKVSIVAENITAPEVSGKFMSYYRFVAPDGSRFGDRLWINIVVEEDNSASHSSATSASPTGVAVKESDSSLDSSRMVTPTLKVRGSANVSTMHSSSTSNTLDGEVPESTDTATTYSEAITSPTSTESELPDIDITSSLDEEEEECDFVLLSDDDEYDQV